MSAPKVSKAVGGITPGGVITVNPGTPIQITDNLDLVDTPYALQCRQIGFSVDSGPLGEVYVNYGNFAGKGDQTALIIQSGTSASLPLHGVVTEGEIDATKWYLDGSEACIVAINFADATS